MAGSRSLAGAGRRPVRDALLACLVVLLLAQALIGGLSLSALDRLALDNTAERVELVARQTAGQIQRGLDMGKPLSQYLGLSDLVGQLPRRVSDVQGVAVVLMDGTPLVELGSVGGSVKPLLRALHSGAGPDGQDWQAPQRLASGAARQAEDDRVRVAVPLAQRGHSEAGALVVTVRPDDAGRRAVLADNLRVLAAVTVLAALALMLTLRYLLPLHLLAAGRAGMWVPLALLLLAQAFYAGYTIHQFRDAWVGVTRSNTQVLARGLQNDLDRVLGYGIAPDHLRGVEKPMARLAGAFPVIGQVRLLGKDGVVLSVADAQGPILARDNDAVKADEVLTLPLRAGGQGPEVARLQVTLDAGRIAAGVRARALDAATVVLVALVAAMELLLLLGLLVNRAFAVRREDASGAPVGLDDPSDVGRIVRPVMFGFLFAVAMPLSFMPLYARALLGGSAGDTAFLVALPIAAEMGCGLLSALFAGRLADRRGWQFPVALGLGVSVLGNLACAFAFDLWSLSLARGLVGLGYGLVWMGLQGFIVIRSPARYRARNMSTVIAGLFAGHLSGAAVGAMLVQQTGIGALFVVAAVLMGLPALGVWGLMWPYRRGARGDGAQADARRPSPPAAVPLERSWRAVCRLLLSRNFGLLLIGSVIPFSIAQVGLLTYALPLYMDARGASVASVGRLLMLYGLCVIYIGPIMGRMADRSFANKYWIVAGGVMGSAGLLGMYVSDSFYAAAAGVLMLALASCLSGGAQTAYMLAQHPVQAYGAGAATSVMRAADKLGQMLGPLVVGGLFASVGMSAGLAATGVVYLAATLLFLLLASRHAAAE